MTKKGREMARVRKIKVKKIKRMKMKSLLWNKSKKINKGILLILGMES